MKDQYLQFSNQYNQQKFDKLRPGKATKDADRALHTHLVLMCIMLLCAAWKLDCPLGCDDLISLLMERGYANANSPEVNSNNKRHVMGALKQLVHWKHQVAIEKMLADIALQKNNFADQPSGYTADRKLMCEAVRQCKAALHDIYTTAQRSDSVKAHRTAVISIAEVATKIHDKSVTDCVLLVTDAMVAHMRPMMKMTVGHHDDALAVCVASERDQDKTSEDVVEGLTKTVRPPLQDSSGTSRAK